MCRRKSSLSPSRAQLVEMMQDLNFGTIDGLIIREHEPVLKPLPRIIRDVKLGGQHNLRSECNLTDFALKAEVIDLFAQFDSFGIDTTLCLEVKHGLPFRIQVEMAA